MLPRLPRSALRDLALGAALLLVILTATAWPVRHALLPLWPEEVEEWLLAGHDAGVERRFVAAPGDSAPSEILTRNRPISLWRVETRTNGVVHAWLVGVRDAASGDLLPRPPALLEKRRIDAPLPESLSLVLAAADGDPVEIASADVARMYRPNALGLTQRLTLALDRLRERWRWPFSPGTAREKVSPG